VGKLQIRGAVEQEYWDNGDISKWCLWNSHGTDAVLLFPRKIF